MDLRLSFAIIIGKIIANVLKLFGSGATAAPGLIALKIDPLLVKKISKKIKNGSVIITGTNGKTTTARLTYEMLSTKFRVIHNRQGSNLLRGIASTLISESSIIGNIHLNLALWEVDEATVPEAIENTFPKTLVFINLFRDQLDRYGEVDSTRAKWQKTIANLNKNVTIILNADDPQVSFLGKLFKGNVVYFGVNDQKLDLPEISHIADIKHCLNCGSNLTYSALLSAHMGHYNCQNCSLTRPKPQVSASDLNFNNDFSTSIKLNVNGQILNVSYSLPGLYNVYNILAASAVANAFNIPNNICQEKIKSFSTAFGRFQTTKIHNRSVIIFLIKNPTGANEVLRVLAKKSKLNILAILNDNIADGRDVSWIWDTDWEVLKGKIQSSGVSGLRAWDLALRLKYAGFYLSKNDVYENIKYSIKAIISNLDIKDTLIILPTYTALLEVQKTLSELGEHPKWHEQ